MKQLTVRGMEPLLEARLREEARCRGQSVNRLVLHLLRRGLGIEVEKQPAVHNDLDHLIGTWSAEEQAEFDLFLAEHRRIDEDLWQ